MNPLAHRLPMAATKVVPATSKNGKCSIGHLHLARGGPDAARGPEFHVTAGAPVYWRVCASFHTSRMAKPRRIDPATTLIIRSVLAPIQRRP